MSQRNKNKHLTYYERFRIQSMLKDGFTFKKIAEEIGCSQSTISKEIKKHRYQKKTTVPMSRINQCKHRFSCKKRDVCKKPKGMKCSKLCKNCYVCNKMCPDFEFEPCRIEERAPYVCNGCKRKNDCYLDQYFYSAKTAEEEYEFLRSESRRGISLTRDELIALDELVSPLILKGQPVSHIMLVHENEIPIGIRTLYGYVEKGVIKARKIDLRRAVKYKTRKRHIDTNPKISSIKKAGKHYIDFLKMLEKKPHQRVVEMDTVCGKRGDQGHVIQTFLWRENNLMIAFKHSTKTMEEMVGTLNMIEECLGTEKFKELFPVILTDNGSEFADPDLFEINADGEIRTQLYYCDPRQSQQKGRLEKNHEYIRYVIPKGVPLDDYTQEEISLMINHINSTKRTKYGCSPYEIAKETFGEDVLKKLGLEKINDDDICLNPSLFK